MSDPERLASTLSIPRILISAAVLDSCLPELITYHQSGFGRIRGELSEELRADLSTAKDIGC